VQENFFDINPNWALVCRGNATFNALFECPLFLNDYNDNVNNNNNNNKNDDDDDDD
jgi:hypothetical protein